MTRAVDVAGRGVRVNGRSVGVGSAIPDSAVVQINAKQLTGFADGNDVAIRLDQSSNIPDLTGTAIYRDSAANGFASVEYDGTDDDHSVDSSTYSQKYVIIAVVSPNLGTSRRLSIAASNSGDDSVVQVNDNQDSYEVFSGNTVTGSTAVGSGLDVVSAVFNGASSEIRVNGSTDVTGDAGTNSLTLLSVGYNPVFSGNRFRGQIPFVEVHDGDVSNGLATRENEIADKFGLTI